MPAISSDPFSRRSVLREEQVQLFAKLIRGLEAAVRRANLPLDDLERFHAMPEYDLCVQGAYALGFVCGDFSIEGFDLAAMACRPQMVAGLPLQELRRYVHVVMRAERWSHRYSSPVREAVEGGVLGMVAERLESDMSLRGLEIIVEADVPVR